jgi:hypothetical protein
MGFLRRRLVPRSVRRATHPVRTLKRAATPKSVRRAQYQLWSIKDPLRRATRGALASVLPGAAKGKTSTPALHFTHSGCTVNHRTIEAAQRCRNGR